MSQTPSKTFKALKEGELKVLLAIVDKTGGSLVFQFHANQLHELADVPSGAIYRIVYALEKAGLVQAGLSKGNGTRGGARRRPYYLTKAGKIYAETWKTAADEFFKKMLKAYPPKPAKTFTTVNTGYTITTSVSGEWYTPSGYAYKP